LSASSLGPAANSGAPSAHHAKGGSSSATGPCTALILCLLTLASLPLAASAQERTALNVHDFGAKGDGTTLNAGSIADAKDWTLSDIHIASADSSTVKVTGSTNVTGIPTFTPSPELAPTGD